MSDIEDRIRRLEDRAALNDLNTRYFLACDGDDLESVGACFTDDATFSSSGVLNATTRDEIVRFIASARGHMGLTVHTPNYALFTFTGEGRASGLLGAHLEMVLAGQPLFGAVRYLDTYRRERGEWRVSSRDMRTIHIAPWSQVGESLLSDRPVRWPGADPSPSDFPRRS
jgi:hypothetical protein